MEEVVEGHRRGDRHHGHLHDDEFGYRWMILNDPDMEDLVVGVNAVSTAIQAGGYGDRVLCAVFAFEDAHGSRSTSSTTTSAAAGTRSSRPGAQQRDNERELRLKAQIGADLPIEPELERWFPLWGIPDLARLIRRWRRSPGVLVVVRGRP